MKTVSVVINARLGSSRVKNKLVRPFAGSSLIAIALEKLETLDFFSHRYLAVAEEELAALAAAYTNIQILKRSPLAVKPGVNPQPVTFAHYGDVPSDYIFVMNPCLPFLSTDTIRSAYDYFQRTNHPSYTSAIPTRDWIFDDEGRALTNSDPTNVTTNLGKAFFKAAHAFHIVDKSFFLKHGYHWTFQKNDPHLIEIPESEAIDVDTEIEFDFAQFAYQKRMASHE